MKNYNLDKRRYVISGVAIAIVVVYIIRLFTLQLLSDDYKKNADSNAFLKKVEFPSRGVIRDRNGKLLVYNQPSYDIMVVTNEAKGHIDTLEFCEALGITKEYFIKRMDAIKDRSKNPGYSRFTPQLFMTQLADRDYSVFQEKLFRFPGFSIQKRSIRQYEYSYAAHVLGDVAEVSQANIDEDDYYQPGDYIGKSGIEKSYEKYLRGEKGMQIMLRDARGRIQGKYHNGALDRKPIAGKDLTLSIDLNLQALGERLLEGKKGAIVAIEPSTGEVLAMVSAPTYDPRMLVGRNRGKVHRMLSRDNWTPLLNRAIMGQYPPGSTFKTSQGLTFLTEGIITPAKYPTVQTAMDTWRDYMVSMGFGYKLGIDLPGEKRGLIPNSKFYDKAYKGSWNGLTIISISIGQGEVNLTPLQIANLGATIANRGYYMVPHVVKGITDTPIDTTFKRKHYTKANRRAYDYIVWGMRNAVLGGTCKALANSDIPICGKTGTAQNRGQDHSVFMGFAPMENPKIAIAVYVENGGFGAEFGVPIGGLMIEQYIHGKLTEAQQRRAEEIQKRRIGYGPRN